MKRNKAVATAAKKQAHRRNQAKARRRKAAMKGGVMAKTLAFVKPSEAVEYASYLAALPQLKALKFPKAATSGVDWAALLPDIVDALASNPKVLAALLPFLLGLIKGGSGGGTGDPGKLPPPVPDTKDEPDEPADEPESGQVIDAFVNTHMTDVRAPGGVNLADNSADIKGGSGTQSLKQRVRLNTDPSLRGRAYPGNDPTVNGPSFRKNDEGGSPIIEWKWTVDGREASNSAELPDPFHLGSYPDNGGTTPTLNLKSPVGAGRHEVKAWPFVRAEFNGGVAVSGESDPIVWFCD